MRLITAILVCLAVVGCTADSQQSDVIARAREFAQASPECESVLGEYPDILDHAQELPSQCPVIAVAFDHDEMLKEQPDPSGKTRLNVRILVRMESTDGSLKSIEVKRTTY